MADLIRKRLTGKEEGFTLIELLVVIVILGILMAIAVPSYLGFQARAQKAAAAANVRAALPSVEAYYGDNNSYSNMTLTILQQSYDAGIKLDAAGVKDLSANSFCIQDTQGTYTYSQTGPAGSITNLACA